MADKILVFMFVRKIKSRKSTCFQIGEKRYGRFKLIKHVGCASTNDEIEALQVKSKQELEDLIFKNQISLFPEIKKSFKAKLLNWNITGYHIVFGKVYDLVGFPNNMLRDLVVARIVHPRSKDATVRYLRDYLGIMLSKDRIYRFLDILDKNKLTEIAYEFVSLKNKGISLIFYDVTTLHFETEKEDEFRKKGFSKDHRGDMPQILIGLFVDYEGYPFDFDFFEGNTFEGHTFKISVEKLIRKYQFENLTVVADAGMLSEDNLSYLDVKKINYIVGARLKNTKEKTIKQIIDHDYIIESIHEIKLDTQRLIIEYSEDRAKKDAKNREKIIDKLKKKLETGKPVVHKNKFLVWGNKDKITSLDDKKIKADEQFDGLKGYVTNSNNQSNFKEIIDQYHNLWKVEKAFRMSKSDLRERPIFHQKIKRIKSHLILCFVSLLVMKEAEKILKRKNYTIEKTIEIIGKVGEGEIRIGNTKMPLESELNQDTKDILKLFLGH
ncbi:MAG: IS1634 family transposase [Candidatus Roizmanbacteria bacterium]|nr:IS1634 family transposase [Candidatus Roizmanbacteria bacterium]